jgi:hypothetical protein
MGTPIALTSLERDMTQPSFMDSTTTGRFLSSGCARRSHDTKKLLQSHRASINLNPPKMAPAKIDIAMPHQNHANILYKIAFNRA